MSEKEWLAKTKRDADRVERAFKLACRGLVLVYLIGLWVGWSIILAPYLVMAALSVCLIPLFFLFQGRSGLVKDIAGGVPIYWRGGRGLALLVAFTIGIGLAAIVVIELQNAGWGLDPALTLGMLISVACPALCLWIDVRHEKKHDLARHAQAHLPGEALGSS